MKREKAAKRKGIFSGASWSRRQLTPGGWGEIHNAHGPAVPGRGSRKGVAQRSGQDELGHTSAPEMEVEGPKGFNGSVPTRFIWSHGGKNVQLCGSFTSWKQLVPMMQDGTQGGKVFAVVCSLEPGYHEYKFLVDGEWVADSCQATTQGRERNWIMVQEPERMEAHEKAALELPAAAERGEGEVETGPVGMVGSLGRRMLDDGGEDGATKTRVKEFLDSRRAYDMMPESGRVVAFDMSMPVQQAFHVLYEQGLHSAPLWDGKELDFGGMLASTDFVRMLQALQQQLPLDEREVYGHTIGEWRDACRREGSSPRELIHVSPSCSLSEVANTIASEAVSNVPVLARGASPDGALPQLLHLASLSSVLACVVRHFRGAPQALPLLSRPIRSLAVGTWAAHLGGRPVSDVPYKSGTRALQPLRTALPSTPLMVALEEMVEGGVGALPVVDEYGHLKDLYARSDVTSLAHENAYARVSLSDISVGQALLFANEGANRHGAATLHQQKVHTCSRDDLLGDVLEALAQPNVRRVVCVEPATRMVEGIITLTDITGALMP